MVLDSSDVPKRKPAEWEPLLSYERFLETRKVQSFDCGDWPGAKSLNDFLNTEEVEEYADMGLGQTTLVFYKGTLVGFFTENPDRLSVDYVKHVKSFTRYPNLKVVNLPSVKIGRLAIQKEWQGKGLGETLIMHIGTAAIEKHGDGVRLLILEAYPKSIPFYEHIGFQLTNGELRAERTRSNKTRTMFFDLNAVRGRDTDDA